MTLCNKIFFTGCWLFSSVVSAGNTLLTVNVPNLKSDLGQLQVSVFNTADSFLNENEEFRIYRFDLESAPHGFQINDLPAGDYALFIFHDENNDQDIERSFLGVPQEGYGFSNNVKPMLSAPDFQDCALSLKEHVNVTISLEY